jgi:hypothetical protein
MDGPIFDNQGKYVATRNGMEAISADGKKSYLIDVNGNLLDKTSNEIVGHLIPGGKYLPDGRPSPAQTIF